MSALSRGRPTILLLRHLHPGPRLEATIAQAVAALAGAGRVATVDRTDPAVVAIRWR